ncbi:ribonuclease P 40kDa subunit-domain-containing protein [Umbelopsis sp. AD052]|nr:ribonuclease P 40kDa subunit-domain-containing protein [Umbelopsis sp. AD052]
MLPQPTNKSHLFLTYFELDSEKKPHSKLIHSHPFNHEIQLLLADTQAETLLQSIAENEQFFYEVEAPLTMFLDTSFLEKNLTKEAGSNQKTSMFYMHTIDTYLDTEDVAIIDGDGHLVLSLQKETYEAFGLEGKAATFTENGRRYIITIDVSAPTFRPGNKTFDRTKWCLDNNLSRSFKMVMTRVDTNTGASLDVLLSNVQHSKKPVSWASSKMDGIRLPNFETLKLPEGATPNNIWKDEALEAHEWLGMATLGSQRLSVNDKPDPFLSVYSCPEPYTTGSVTSLRSAGLVTPQYIENLLITLRKEIKAKQCWGALTVWGYRDSPIAWRGREHGFLTSGENDYTILLLREEKDASEQRAVCYQALGVYDTL